MNTGFDFVVYIVLVKERWITGTGGDTLICGVHRDRPSKERIKKYSESFQVEEDCFEISDDFASRGIIRAGELDG